MLFSLNKLHPNITVGYTIVDGDKVEKNNLMRQPFIEEDLGLFKAETLAERYQAAYDLPIYHSNQYIESKEQLNDLFHAHAYNGTTLCILIGCVDNNASRKIMHDLYTMYDTMVYIDAGIDAVMEDDLVESGYSGQVVVGYRARGKSILPATGEVYPDILSDTDSRLPTQACGLQAVYHPQRMQTNEMAAIVLAGYMNTILFDRTIVSQYTNFNAYTQTTKPTYITKEQFELGMGGFIYV